MVQETYNQQYKHLADKALPEKDNNALVEKVKGTIIARILPSHFVSQESDSGNIFDTIATLRKPKRQDVRDELECYLSTDPEMVDDPLKWWYEKEKMYLGLSQMARDFLSIPGASFCSLYQWLIG